MLYKYKPDKTIHDQIKLFLVYFGVVTISLAILSNLFPSPNPSPRLGAEAASAKPKPPPPSPEDVSRGPCYSFNAYVSRGCR